MMRRGLGHEIGGQASDVRVWPRFALALGPRNGRARRKNDLGCTSSIASAARALLRLELATVGGKGLSRVTRLLVARSAAR